MKCVKKKYIYFERKNLVSARVNEITVYGFLKMN